MRLTVHLHTILQRQTPEGPVRRLEEEMPAGGTLGDLLRQLGLELDLEATLLVVNGRMAGVAQVLQDGDVVHLMPAIAGGS